MEIGTPVSSADLCDLWSRLLVGRAIVRRVYNTDTHHYIELLPSDRAPIRSEWTELLERMLFGDQQKVIALEEHRAPSLVAASLSECLRLLGVKCRSSSVPFTLLILAHAGRKAGWLCEHGQVRLEASGQDLYLLSVCRPDRVLVRTLSRAEHAVLRLSIDGLSHAEIAALRGTSLRTVANQLAKVYSKLGVSGRIGVMCRLLSPRFEAHALAKPNVVELELRSTG